MYRGRLKGAILNLALITLVFIVDATDRTYIGCLGIVWCGRWQTVPLSLTSSLFPLCQSRLSQHHHYLGPSLPLMSRQRYENRDSNTLWRYTSTLVIPHEHPERYYIFLHAWETDHGLQKIKKEEKHFIGAPQNIQRAGQSCSKGVSILFS